MGVVMQRAIRDPRNKVLTQVRGICGCCETEARPMLWYHTDYPDMTLCASCMDDEIGIPPGEKYYHRLSQAHDQWDALAKKLGYEVITR